MEESFRAEGMERDGLEEVRRGSLVERFLEVERGNGAKSRRGPYQPYSCKDNGKTLSRRITGRSQIPDYHQQIHGFRRFQELVRTTRRPAPPKRTGLRRERTLKRPRIGSALLRACSLGAGVCAGAEVEPPLHSWGVRVLGAKSSTQV